MRTKGIIIILKVSTLLVVILSTTLLCKKDSKCCLVCLERGVDSTSLTSRENPSFAALKVLYHQHIYYCFLSSKE